MASLTSRLDQMEARLVYLEKRDGANNKEIIKLKDANIELQTKVLDLKRENSMVMEKLKEYDAKMGEMKSVTDKMSECHKDVASRLSKMDTNTKKTTEHLTSELDVVRKLQKIFNRVVVKQHEHGMAKTIEYMKDQVKALAEENDIKNKSVFHSLINLSQPLVAKKWTQCDKFTRSFCNPGNHFKTDVCVYETPVTGLYGLSVNTRQKGHGKIKARGRVNNYMIPIPGRTAKNDDVISYFIIKSLDKGDKVFVEVMLEEGDAEMDHCVFKGFLIHLS